MGAGGSVRLPDPNTSAPGGAMPAGDAQRRRVAGEWGGGLKKDGRRATAGGERGGGRIDNQYIGRRYVPFGGPYF